MQGYRPNEDGSFKLENGVFIVFVNVHKLTLIEIISLLLMKLIEVI